MTRLKNSFCERIIIGYMSVLEMGYLALVCGARLVINNGNLIGK